MAVTNGIIGKVNRGREGNKPRRRETNRGDAETQRKEIRKGKRKMGKMGT
jgi:hypothetical protein